MVFLNNIVWISIVPVGCTGLQPTVQGVPVLLPPPRLLPPLPARPQPHLTTDRPQLPARLARLPAERSSQTEMVNIWRVFRMELRGESYRSH